MSLRKAWSRENRRYQRIARRIAETLPCRRMARRYDPREVIQTYIEFDDRDRAATRLATQSLTAAIRARRFRYYVPLEVPQAVEHAFISGPVRLIRCFDMEKSRMRTYVHVSTVK